MASERLTAYDDADLDVGAAAVIDAYLAELTGRLPTYAPLAADVRAELRADLVETTMALVPESASAVVAARTATAQFGEVEYLAAAFRPELAVRQARRMGWTLLVSGPLVGASWLTTVFLTASNPATVWRWLPLVTVPLLLVGAPATVLTVASTGRLTRWLRPPAGLTSGAVAVAGLTAGTLDVFLLLGSAALLLLPVPAPSPLVALAAAASLARLVLVGRAAVRLLKCARPPAVRPRRRNACQEGS
jgi:hypothetical protein